MQQGLAASMRRIARADFKRCFDDGVPNARVLEMIKASGSGSVCSALTPATRSDRLRLTAIMRTT